MEIDGPPPDGWHSARQIADAYGVAVSTAKIKMDRLVKDGKVESKVYRVMGHPTTYYKAA